MSRAAESGVLPVTERESLVGTWLVRDLVEACPGVTELLEPWGIDTCCGGGRQLEEALRLNGAPVDATLAAISELVLSQQREE